MLNKLAAHLTDKLVSNGNIRAEEKDLYLYGLFILLSHIMYLFFVSVAGVALNCFFESLVFYISFQFIRRYAGGYHASTETRCEVLSTLSIVSCIVLIKLSKTYNMQTVLFIISMISTVCIFLLCPLDNEEKRLTEKERKYFRRISLIILLIIAVTVIVSYLFRFNSFIVPCSLSLILESFLLISGNAKMFFQKKKTE